MFKVTRQFGMPNKNTFTILPINKFLHQQISINDLKQKTIIDPFSNGEVEFANCTNDLNPDVKADTHLDAIDFLKTFASNSVDLVLYDPPYSPRQVSESYHHFGKEITKLDTSAHFRKAHLDEIARIIKPGGKCICFGWNSNGVGKIRNFKLNEILLVNHGGSHNDTIVTVETKGTKLK